MQFSVKVIIAACAVVGVAEIGRHSLVSTRYGGLLASRRLNPNVDSFRTVPVVQ